MNLRESVDRCLIKAKHTGQHLFETPTTGPKSYAYKFRFNSKNLRTIKVTFKSFNKCLNDMLGGRLLFDSPARRETMEASQCCEPLNERTFQFWSAWKKVAFKCSNCIFVFTSLAKASTLRESFGVLRSSKAVAIFSR